VVDNIERRTKDFSPSAMRIRIDEIWIKPSVQKRLSLLSSAFLCITIKPGTIFAQELAPFPQMVLIEGDEIDLILADIVVSIFMAFRIAGVGYPVARTLGLLKTVPDIVGFRSDIFINTSMQPSAELLTSFFPKW
jgi:hypothetical protein